VLKSNSRRIDNMISTYYHSVLFSLLRWPRHGRSGRGLGKKRSCRMPDTSSSTIATGWVANVCAAATGTAERGAAAEPHART
jgi:hypothetical protein